MLTLLPVWPGSVLRTKVARLLTATGGSSGVGYFTLNGRHFVLAAVCRAVLAIVARMW